MKKKNRNNDFVNVSNEKQNSLASGIRIGLGGKSPVLKQKFVKIKEVEYSTDFEIFLENQVYVIVRRDKSFVICSRLEKKVFYDGYHYINDAAVFELLETIHRDIISFKYGGELVY